MFSNSQLEKTLEQASKEIHIILDQKKHPMLYKDYAPSIGLFHSPSKDNPEQTDNENIKLNQFLERLNPYEKTVMHGTCKNIREKIIDIKLSSLNKLQDLYDYLVKIKDTVTDYHSIIMLQQFITAVQQFRGIEQPAPRPAFIGIYGI